MNRIYSLFYLLFFSYLYRATFYLIKIAQALMLCKYVYLKELSGEN